MTRFKSRLLALMLLVCAALAIACSAEPGDDGATGEQVSALTAGPCLSDPVPGGSVGYQSRTRYISKLVPDSTLAYALRATWAINGVNQGSGTISFGPNSGALMKTGTDCGAPGVDARDCAPNGFTSPCTSGSCLGASDRIWKLWFSNGVDETVTQYIPVVRVYANDVQILELWGLNITSNTGAAWTWGTTGLTKIRADVDPSTRKFWWDGYNASNALESHFNSWGNNSCIGR